MAKKKTVVTTVEEPENDTPVMDAELDDDEALPPDPLTEVLDEFDSIAKFQLYRMPGRRYLYSGPVDELGGSLYQFTAENYGGGKYMVQFREESGQIRKSKRFEIDPAVRAKTGGMAGPAANGGGEKSELVELLREVLRERQPAPSLDVSQIMGPMIQASTEMARALMENMKPQPQPAPPWELIVPLVQGAMELGAEVKKGDGEGGGYLPLVERFAGMIEKAMTRRAAGSPAPNARGEEKPGSIPAPGSQPPQTFIQAAGVNEPGWVKGLRPYLPQILNWAKDDVPPEMVIDALDSAAPAMLQWLASRDVETWPGELASFVPELVPHTAWVKKFLLALGDDEEPESDDEPQAHGV